MVIFRSINHIYAQIVKPTQAGDLVLAQASSVDKSLSKKLDGNKVSQATEVGKLIAKRAKEKDITEIAFDRNGYRYHGRVKALADSAREAGLIF
jgi:large subunit ribosomal protein L18